VVSGNDPSVSKDRLVRLKYTPCYDNSKSTSTSTSTSMKMKGSIGDSNSDGGREGGGIDDGGAVFFPQTAVTLSAAAANSDLGGVVSTSASAGAGAGAGASLSMQRPVVLVGKGVTYDTGGINLKSANSMKTMKHDMGGSAAALGTLLALTQTSFPYPVECWLAIVENNIDVNAYRPDDVVTAVTGTSIEIVHTDAEGRMILADVLALASRKVRKLAFHSLNDALSPSLMIDFATLTGTCISSLSNRYIGAFTNRRNYVEQIIQAGESCGERVWPFPCDDDFEEDLKSDIADVLQCRQPTEADHIYATSFLKMFVNPAVPWVHLDLGSAYRPGGLGHVGSDYTGSGVRAATAIIKKILFSKQ
jgi:leucyl aminopeptidase